jgi:hypothetical protein
MVSSVTQVMYLSYYIRKKLPPRQSSELEKQDTQGKDGKNNFTLRVKE